MITINLQINVEMETFKHFILSNQIFCYTCCNTRKRVTNLRNQLRVILRLRATQLHFEKMLQRWRNVCNTASDLTDQRSEFQTSRSTDDALPLHQAIKLNASHR